MLQGFTPGWKGIDDTQRAAAAGFRALAHAAPHLMAYHADFAGDDRPILLYEAFRKVLGSDPDYPPQTIGDCVSMGFGHGNDLLQCIQIAGGDDGEWEPTDTEVVYGFAREISGDLGPEDGSYGAAAVKGLTRWGMVSRPMMDAILGAGQGGYDGRRAKLYGHKGCPAKVKDAARPYLLGNAAIADTYDEIVASLRAACPVPECSMFLPDGKRDKDGFVRPSNQSGGHCQCIIGARFDRPGLCILNSWPLSYYSGPRGLDCPPGAYWLDRKYVEKWICGSGDNWALSRTREFAVRAWDWSRIA